MKKKSIDQIVREKEKKSSERETTEVGTA